MTMKDSFENIMTLVYLIAAILSPIIGGTVTFKESQDPVESIKTGILILAIFVVVAFIYRVFQKIGERWAGSTAEGIDNWLRTVFSGFQGKYLRYITYRHRDFDVKGLSTQGVFTLELERIFVELNVSPQAFHRVSTNIIAAPSSELLKGSHALWDYLAVKGYSPKKLVIIGAPGSGKTTLLKNVALVLANKNRKSRKKSRNKVPVLLFLREHAETINVSPDISLSELIHNSVGKYRLSPPPLWFEKALKHGRCIVMLDGLDEVAEPTIRKKVVTWADKQILTYPRNHFIVTSRPFGYRESQLNGVLVLEVAPFSIKQVKQFIDNWYLANEIQSHQKDDEGVRLKAGEGADDLFSRLRKAPTLLDLAVNPLLLTMIATVHRYRSSLPGRRVELYKEICDVFLGKRQSARGMELPLTPAQKQSVLQPLAYYMMSEHLQQIDRQSALEALAERLKFVSPQNTGADFLQMIENSSGLLLERESGIYGFAHKTFQEYLASAYILEQNLEKELVSHIEDDWWHECIRLYTAQANATMTIEGCLANTPPSARALTLAIACEDEAREVHPSVRQKLEDVLLQGVESQDRGTRTIIANALLSLHIRGMMRIDDNTYISKRLVNHAEYQLFLDEMLDQGRHCQPDHWNSEQFSPGIGLEPVRGIRSADAQEFCSWLTRRENGEWRIRFPDQDEVSLSKTEMQRDIRYWISKGRNSDDPVLYPKSGTSTVDLRLIGTTMNEDLKIVRHMDQALGLDVTRTLNAAKPMISKIIGCLEGASYHDLGGSGFAFDQTDWAVASTLLRDLSKLIKDAKERMDRFDKELDSLNLISLSLEIARQIHKAHDNLRSMYSPSSYAPDRANRSRKSAREIINTARQLNNHLSYLEVDIEKAKSLNKEILNKLTGGINLKIIGATDIAMKIDSEKLRDLLLHYRNHSSKNFTEIFDLDYSAYPLLERPMTLLMDRDALMQTQIGLVRTKKLLSWYMRTLIMLVLEEIYSRQKLPDFWNKAENKRSTRKNNLEQTAENLQCIYLMLVDLEARCQGSLPAIESIRIVRERTHDRL